MSMLPKKGVKLVYLRTWRVAVTMFRFLATQDELECKKYECDAIFSSYAEQCHCSLSPGYV